MTRFAILLALVGACSKAPAVAEPPPRPVPPPIEQVDLAPPPAQDAAVASTARVMIGAPGGELAVATEVVSEGNELERGLMYREYLAPDAGMLFLMGKDFDWAFWMKNTLIPLDMLFITKDLVIAGVVENAEPKTETLRRVGALSRYVLEVNGGWTAQHHVKSGQRVRFVAVPIP